jgi:uncharacterized DUF497 family protein
MQDERFEWSDAKAHGNLKKHDVSFEMARLVFDDPAALDGIDDRTDHTEDLYVITGRVGGS